VRREAFFSGPFHDHLVSYRQLRFEGERLFAFARAWGIIMVLTLLGTILYGLPKLGIFSGQILLGYILTLMYLKTPLDRVQDNVPIYNEGRLAIEHLQSLGLSLDRIANSLRAAGKGDEQNSSPVKAKTNILGRIPQRSFQQIELAGVTHKYYREQDEREFELGPIDLTINSGEMIFLVGGNGSGKTTLAKLLIGLYVPEAGNIFFDGQPISDDEREWYSQHFAVVFSDFFLFESLLGLETPAHDLDARAREYLLQLQLDHKVQVNSGVLSTTKLSQGQRKRLALLTAFLEDRPIYLFDEWAADQDPTFKRVFYHELLPELKARGKTVIVISHDDHYYYMADRIVKLDSGKLDRIDYAPELLEPHSVQVN
jgi:putative ATP-binding cassette transporter